jgi:hypothetical protein
MGPKGRPDTKTNWPTDRRSQTPLHSTPVTGRGHPCGCELLRTPHCLDSRLTDDGEVISLTYRPRSTRQTHFVIFVSVTNFSYRLWEPKRLLWSKGFSCLAGCRTWDYQPCCIAPQPLRYRVLPTKLSNRYRVEVVPDMIF